MGNKIRVNGIKLSGELVHIDLLPGPDRGNLHARFLQSMAENRINLPFLSYSAMDRRTDASFCIAAEDFGRLNYILARDPDLEKAMECISPVGAVSLFPHNFSIGFFGCLLHVFGQASLTFYGMASSLSALTVTTDFHLLDRAVELIEPYISLPSYHAPFASRLRIKSI